MKRLNVFLSLALALILIPGTGHAAPAAARRPIAKFILSEVTTTLAQLNLTADQKAAIKQTLMSHKEAAVSDIKAVVEARKVLFQAVHQDRFDEPAVRSAAKEAAAAQAELVVLHARVVSEVRSVLTPEQKTLLQERREELAAKVDAAVTRVMAFVEKLLALLS